ncbi:hypothetical protein RHGRI_023081 [Rhododendron griersonianum]|uniref:Uncharacterized protein n=1 Tax=Rhododendron griersonianum TaxID=479676 RepID=A0AAV6J7P9_9ERIC|nr:hypothetical protein RHGRI_023081 [Rhododendron griersonianum]
MAAANNAKDVSPHEVFKAHLKRPAESSSSSSSSSTGQSSSEEDHETVSHRHHKRVQQMMSLLVAPQMLALLSQPGERRYIRLSNDDLISVTVAMGSGHIKFL